MILAGMADCCCPEPAAVAEPVACPACQTASKPVDSLTVKALLTEVALRRLEAADYRFCAGRGCDVVYFAGGGSTFVAGDVRVRVGQKEPAGLGTVCYCFGENEVDIAEEIERTGDSLAVDRVRTHIAAGRCACEVRNPKGACCLGDVMSAVERLRRAVKGVARP